MVQLFPFLVLSPDNNLDSDKDDIATSVDSACSVLGAEEGQVEYSRADLPPLPPRTSAKVFIFMFQ